jgi:hypothetical protein
MLLLTAGLWAARDGRPGDTTAYLVDAVDLAAHTGERNHLRFHFGPTNMPAWELGLAVETGTGPGAADVSLPPIELVDVRKKATGSRYHLRPGPCLRAS